MKKMGKLSFSVLFFLFVLFSSLALVPTMTALVNENVRTWVWTYNTGIGSVCYGDVDGDGSVEIVTGGDYFDGTYVRAQLVVWDGSTLALENVKTWVWDYETYLLSVCCGDVDGDGDAEIVTGGFYRRWVAPSICIAQLCVWNGATLALENVRTWYWVSDTVINSVAVGDVDGDGAVEIVTGGYCSPFPPHTRAQLCVWDGATLTLEGVKSWYTVSDTYINSVAVGDVDGDGSVEIVTGGDYWTTVRYWTQLAVWNGATLALEGARTWYWVSDTRIYSVAVGNVDGDGQVEIMTGGYHHDGTRKNAQLAVWNGATLALEGVKTWYWVSDTVINSVAVGDVDGDSQTEIVTGGDYFDGTRLVAQLVVWDGSNLAFEDVKTWHWTGDTYIDSVAVGDVDGDGDVEVVTGGEYRYPLTLLLIAQLCVWGY